MKKNSRIDFLNQMRKNDPAAFNQEEMSEKEYTILRILKSTEKMKTNYCQVAIATLEAAADRSNIMIAGDERRLKFMDECLLENKLEKFSWEELNQAEKAAKIADQLTGIAEAFSRSRLIFIATEILKAEEAWL